MRMFYSRYSVFLLFISLGAETHHKLSFSPFVTSAIPLKILHPLGHTLKAENFGNSFLFFPGSQMRPPPLTINKIYCLTQQKSPDISFHLSLLKLFSADNRRSFIFSGEFIILIKMDQGICIGKLKMRGNLFK